MSYGDKGPYLKYDEEAFLKHAEHFKTLIYALGYL